MRSLAAYRLAALKRRLRSLFTHDNAPYHAGPSETKIVVHCNLDILLRPQIAFGGLDRRMAEQEFDLLQIAAILPAELCAGSAEVMSTEVLDADLLG